MVGMATPLVKGHGGAIITALGLFWSGALFSAVLTGTLFAATGWVVQPALAHQLWWAVIALIALVLAAADLGIGRLRTPGFRRQTCSWWWRTMGPAKAWLAWGAHLGLGFATVRASSLYWAVVAIVILVAPAVVGPMIMAAYATGLVAGIGIIIIANGLLRLSDRGAGALLGTRRGIRTTSGAILTVLAAVALVFSLNR